MTPMPAAQLRTSRRRARAQNRPPFIRMLGAADCACLDIAELLSDIYSCAHDTSCRTRGPNLYATGALRPSLVDAYDQAGR
jgi:hypothetical protein